MTLIIINQTPVSRSYLSGTVTVPASNSLNVSANQTFSISRDSVLVSDCTTGNVVLSDGVNLYSGNTALNYLNQIATGIGGAVVGLIGYGAPNFAINVGGKDVNGNTINSSFDAGQNLRTSNTVSYSAQYQAMSVSTSAVEALGGQSRLVGRKLICITPTGGTVYWGTDSNVTTSTGQPILINTTQSLPFTDGLPIYLIAASKIDVRVTEAK